MRTSRARRAAALLAVPALLALGACSEGDADRAVERATDEARDAASSALEDVELPDVDWQEYGRDVKRRIDRAAEEADCATLREELVQLESASSEVTDYIEARLEEAGC